MMSWTKFHSSVTKTPCLMPCGINLFPHNFLGQYRTALGMEAQQLTGLRSSWSGDLVTHLTSIQSRQCRPGWRSRWKITNAPTWSSGRRPYRWSGSRGPRRFTSWRTWWWGCRQGCRRWLQGRVAWPDIKLTVKKEIYVFSTFTLFYHCFFVQPVNTFRVHCSSRGNPYGELLSLLEHHSFLFFHCGVVFCVIKSSHTEIVDIFFM